MATNKRVSKAEMIRFVENITFSKYCHNDSGCLRRKLGKPTMKCFDCQDAIVRAIVRLIKGAK